MHQLCVGGIQKLFFITIPNPDKLSANSSYKKSNKEQCYLFQEMYKVPAMFCHKMAEVSIIYQSEWYN